MAQPAPLQPFVLSLFLRILNAMEIRNLRFRRPYPRAAIAVPILSFCGKAAAQSVDLIPPCTLLQNPSGCRFLLISGIDSLASDDPKGAATGLVSSFTTSSLFPLVSDAELASLLLLRVSAFRPISTMRG
jgi:hypothetical protein